MMSWSLYFLHIRETVRDNQAAGNRQEGSRSALYSKL